MLPLSRTSGRNLFILVSVVVAVFAVLILLGGDLEHGPLFVPSTP